MSNGNQNPNLLTVPPTPGVNYVENSNSNWDAPGRIESSSEAVAASVR